MGEAKRRKKLDPSYGKGLSYNEWVDQIHQLANQEKWEELCRLQANKHYSDYSRKLESESDPVMVEKDTNIKLQMMVFLLSGTMSQPTPNY